MRSTAKVASPLLVLLVHLAPVATLAQDAPPEVCTYFVTLALLDNR
jgi:hypothetical protein